MFIKQEALLDLLGRPGAQLVIPVYQRVYAWNQRQCDGLWDDVLRAGRTGAGHFMGTVLYAEERGTGAAERRLDIIDGQQRMATVTLLLCALRDWLADQGGALGVVDAHLIDERYLHADGSEDGPKLLLSRVDRGTLSAVIDGASLPDDDDASLNVLGNYELFRAKMGEGFDAHDAEALWRGLSLLLVVGAQLEAQDRPQLVFESLNSKGVPLTTADLVRNLLLVNASYSEQARLYERYWAPIEDLLGAADVDGFDAEGGGKEGAQGARLAVDRDESAPAESGGDAALVAALHGWLALRAPQVPIGGSGGVYPAFKAFLEHGYRGTAEELLADLHEFCERFATTTLRGYNLQAARSRTSAGAATAAHGRSLEGGPLGLVSSERLFGD